MSRKKKLQSRELKLEAFLDEMPTLEARLQAELEHVQAQIGNLEVQEDLNPPTPQHPVDIINRDTDKEILEYMTKKAPHRSNFGSGEDPNGIGQHEPGSKLDAGKLKAGLAVSDFPRALKSFMEVVSYGEGKYTASGWLSVPKAEERYKDAMYRHLIAAETEEIDPESKLPHMAHALWNCMAIVELKARREESKDYMTATEILKRKAAL